MMRKTEGLPFSVFHSKTLRLYGTEHSNNQKTANDCHLTFFRLSNFGKIQ